METPACDAKACSKLFVLVSLCHTGRSALRPASKKPSWPFASSEAVLILAASLKQVADMRASLQTETADAEGDFVPVERVEGALDAGVIVICDHASNGLPAA
jgi:hypothetical protein